MITIDFLPFFRKMFEEFNNWDDTAVTHIHNMVIEMFTILKEHGYKYDYANCLVVAHYLILQNQSSGEGVVEGSAGGMLSSASIGDINISLVTPPVHDFFDTFFGSTKYGQMFLAWLAMVGALRYVNGSAPISPDKI